MEYMAYKFSQKSMVSKFDQVNAQKQDLQHHININRSTITYIVIMRLLQIVVFDIPL
jgi:hypothetical protein